MPEPSSRFLAAPTKARWTAEAPSQQSMRPAVAVDLRLGTGSSSQAGSTGAGMGEERMGGDGHGHMMKAFAERGAHTR
jgi:hypothetical protein